MKGLAEAVKKLKLFNPDEFVDEGRRAYRLGIEERDCPKTEDRSRKLWLEGYRKERDKFTQLLQRNGGNLR